MEFIKTNKWAIAIVAGGLLLAYVYTSYFGSSDDPLLTSTADSDSAAVTEELISALSNLRAIKLDESIFSDPVFISLSDFGVVIPPQPVGRRNPFAPFVRTSTSTRVIVPGTPR